MVEGRHVIRAAAFQSVGNTVVQMSGMSCCEVIQILCTLPSSSRWHRVTTVTLGNRLQRVTFQMLWCRTWLEVSIQEEVEISVHHLEFVLIYRQPVRLN